MDGMIFGGLEGAARPSGLAGAELGGAADGVMAGFVDAAPAPLAEALPAAEAVGAGALLPEAGLAAILGGAAYLAYRGQVSTVPVAGFDGGANGVAPISAEVNGRAGTATLFHGSPGDTPDVANTHTVPLQLGADGALRSRSGAVVARFDGHAVTPEPGVSVTALFHGPDATAPSGPGLGTPVDGSDESGAPAPSAPAVADVNGAGNKLLPGGVGRVRRDGECDENGNLGPTVPTSRLPRKGTWQGEVGNSPFLSSDPAVKAITGDKAINFVNSRLDFTPWAGQSINFPPGVLTGNSKKDRALVEKALVDGPDPNIRSIEDARKYLRDNGLTPHHATDTCMQLVPEVLNSRIAHIGSAADLLHQRRIGWSHQAP